MKLSISKGKLVRERIGCYSEIGTQDYVRTGSEAKGWPDKNMPIALCYKHSSNHKMVKKVKFDNGKIIIMAELDIKLPPHIKLIQGSYFNTATNKWIGQYKIEQICKQYWEEYDITSIEVKQPNGTIAYKNITNVEPITSDNIQKMDLTDYCKHRSFSKANFYVLKKAGFIRFTDDAKQLWVDVIETDKLLDAKALNKQKSKDKKVQKYVPVVKRSLEERAKEIDERIERENAEYDLKHSKKIDKEPEQITLNIPLTENKLAQLELPEDFTEPELKKILKVVDALKTNEPKKERGYISMPIISAYEVLQDLDDSTNFNTPSIMFLLEEHNSLEALIVNKLSEYGVNWFELKNSKEIKSDANGNGFWYEEYMAIICHCLYCHLPITDKIEWISKFINRSFNEVVNLLAIHYREYYSNGYCPRDFYIDFYSDISFRIVDYFIRYYKFDYSYKYRGDDNK